MPSHEAYYEILSMKGCPFCRRAASVSHDQTSYAVRYLPPGQMADLQERFGYYKYPLVMYVPAPGKNGEPSVPEFIGGSDDLEKHLKRKQLNG